MLKDKHNYVFVTLFFLFVFSLVGCNSKEAIKPNSIEKNNLIQLVTLDGKTITSASVSKVGQSMVDVKKPHIIYNQENPKQLQMFVEAIKRAKKVNGIVDVTTPDYLLTLTFKDETISKYKLWLWEDGGSIMNEKNTHYIYRLPKDLIDDLNKTVNKKKEPNPYVN